MLVDRRLGGEMGRMYIHLALRAGATHVHAAVGHVGVVHCGWIGLSR